MKINIIILALVAICFADEIDHKKRGVTKGASVNSISASTHPKPETASIQQNSQHHSNIQQSTVNQQYPQSDVAPQQQVYSVPHQLIPIQIVPQHLLAPRFQLLASRNPHGQMQLTLIPHNVFMNLIYGNQLVPNSLSQPIVSNHLQQSIQSPTIPPTVETVYNNYVTPQPLVYAQPSQVPLSQNNYYQNQQVPLPYTYSSTSQPIYSQPMPSYSHNNFITPSVSNSVYNPNSYYYPSNSQSKYQNVYVSSGQQYEQQPNYQTIPNSEYEKSNLAQTPHQIHKNDVSMHTSDFLPPPDTHFKPIHAYPRGPISYKQ